MAQPSTWRVRLARGIANIREYGRIAGFWQIARRAFANNSFDGVLTTIGLLMGSYVAGVRDASVVIRTGVATSMAMGISGLWGSWLAESAERGRELAELERHSLTDLGQTKIGRASRMAVVVVSVVDGLAPFVSSMFVLIPLFFAPMIGDIVIGYALCMAVALISLFGLGVFLGSISGTSIVSYGLKTVVAGIVAIAFSSLLGA
jgi:predicted membrane protein (TIGR00267 family)